MAAQVPGAGPRSPRSGRPLHVLAQIDCAELPRIDPGLPERGLLLFFARIDGEMDWLDEPPREFCRVPYAPEPGDTRTTAAPSDLPVIEGSYSNFQRKLVLKGEPGPVVYPSAPLRAYAARLRQVRSVEPMLRTRCLKIRTGVKLSAAARAGPEAIAKFRRRAGPS